MSTQISNRDSLDILEDKIEQGFRFVTIISEGVLMAGLGYAGFKLAHRGATPEVLDQIWLVSQVLALDLSAPGLFAMATRAREQGNERHAKWAIRVAIVLIIMSILTMVEGAVTSYLPNIPHDIILYVTVAMMVIRGAASVGYSVFRRLHKSANSANSATVVAPAVEEHAIVAQMENLQQQLSQVTAQMEAVKVAPVVETEFAAEDETNTPFIDDITAYRMRQEKDTDSMPVVSVEDETIQPKITRKLSSRNASNSGRGEARQKALRIIKRNPGIKAAELARRAGISPQYASTILSEMA